MRTAARPAGAVLAAVLTLLALAGCRSRGADNSAGSPPRQSPASASVSASGAPASATSSTSAPARQVTRVVHFQAFTGSGAPSTAVRAAGSGQCFTTSITVPVAGVYRCFGNKEILDPCFAAPAAAAATSVVCYADPWSAARRLVLTAPLPKATPLQHHRPWAMQLADGVRCVSVTGTVQIDRGVPLTYECRDGRAAGIASEHAGLVVASYGQPPDGPLRRIAVTTMWTA